MSGARTMMRGRRPARHIRLCVLVVMLAVVGTSTSALASPRRTTTYNGSIRLAHGPYNALTATGAACDLLQRS